MYRHSTSKLVALAMAIAVLVMALPLGFACDREGKEAPQADFTAEPTSGTAPLQVQFTDRSEGEVTDWAWDFDNDGVPDSTERSPSYIYETPGEYTVSLEVTGPGGSDREIKAQYIEVAGAGPALEADFSAEPTSGAAPLEVQFTDQSAGDIASWSWNFGDGLSSTEQNPSHTYQNAGTYTVSLTVSNPAGSDTETKAGFITVCRAPVAGFSAAPTTGLAPLAVQFTDQSTGVITAWEWDFDNDGVVNSTEQNPSHTYNTAGDYSVSLKASNPAGSDTETKAEYIHVTSLALEVPDIELYQYVKGATVDIDDATINAMAEGGGEGGANTMFMAMAPGLAGQLPLGKEYANLTDGQKDMVAVELAAFLDSVDAAIADPGVTLQENPAYVLLHELPGMAWFGKWSQEGWDPVDAFWATWPDPAGRGGLSEFRDWVAINGLADVTGNTAYTWAGGDTKYAELSAADRAEIDADLQLFYDTMAIEADPAAVSGAFTAELANWPDAFAAAMAAGMAAGAPGTPEFMAAFMAELGTNWPECYRASVAATMQVAKDAEAFEVLKTLGKPAADGWAADIDAGVHPRQAFFRWMAKIPVSAMAAAGVMVELSVGEFSFRVTNPNDYLISLDNLFVNISVNSDGFGLLPALDVDAAKVAVGNKIWVPAAEDGVDGELIVKLSAPTKWLDMVTWMVTEGYDSTAAGMYASDVWRQIHISGTADFDVTVEATISGAGDTITVNYALQWTGGSYGQDGNQQAEAAGLPVEAPSMDVYQYLKGATVDFDDATINTMAEGGGEGAAYAMAMAYAGLDLPPGKEYANLTDAQKEIVSAWLVAFLGMVEASIDAGEALTDNPAYITLHQLPGMAWFGKWSQEGWDPVDAFWGTWPDPAGRGGLSQFRDWVAANGLPDYGAVTYNWTGAGAGAKYAELSAVDRATIDADLATFLATMQSEVDAANAAAADAFSVEIQKPVWADAFAAAFAAGMAANPDPYSDEFVAAFQGELAANWPEAYAACVGASTVAMMGAVMGSEAFAVLKTLGKPAADGWAADIEAGVHPRQALFRWLAKPAVSAMAAAAPLIQLSVGEFSYKVTNPNDYMISLDSLSINISVESNGFGYYPTLDVDAAKLAIGDKIWVPANGEVIVPLSAPIKWLDMVTWMVMAGYDSTTAGTYVSDVWKQIHVLGTAVFEITVEATISGGGDTITETYVLQWGPDSSPPPGVVETDAIVVGVLGDFSGPSANVAKPLYDGLLDYFRMAEEDGLIPGAKIRLALYDTKFDPARYIPGYDWCKGQGAQVIFTYFAEFGEILKPLAEVDKIPIVNAGTSWPQLEPPGWVFCADSPTSYQAKSLLKWISEEHWDYYYQGVPKIGLAGWNTSYDMEVEQAMREYCQAHPDKFEYVGGYLAPAGTMTWAGEVEALKDCDYVFILPTGPGAASFAREFRNRGYTGTFIGTDSLAAYRGLIVDWCGWYDLDGTLTAQGTLWWTDDVPMVNLAKQLLYEYRPGEAEEVIWSGLGYLAGVHQAALLFDILEAAIEEVGAENFDGQAFYNAAVVFDTAWEGYPEWGFTETKRYATDHVAIYDWSAEVEDLVRITDWLPLVVE